MPRQVRIREGDYLRIPEPYFVVAKARGGNLTIYVPTLLEADYPIPLDTLEEVRAAALRHQEKIDRGPNRGDTAK